MARFRHTSLPTSPMARSQRMASGAYCILWSVCEPSRNAAVDILDDDQARRHVATTLGGRHRCVGDAAGSCDR